MSFRPLKIIMPLMMFALAILSLAGSTEAEEAPAFELPPAQGAADMPEPSAFRLDAALGAVGLPALAKTSDDESIYEKAWRMSEGPGGSTRLTYGERYRRNPDGSYGDRSSSQWNSGNIGDRLLEQALSAGSGFFSSWAEGWLGGYGKARISLRVNDEGDVTGSGDFLYPIYDSESTTFFTQFGLRTMANDRVIGNFGLGQRFFLAENFALGYNAFIDQDFSRNHTRGGAGVEAWYDWVRLSANYYTPLSGWKNSKDYDSRFVEERPAEGYDARLTGYLPFYRNLALTGAFEKWKGEQVGAFGSDDFLSKDPTVWSYGLEWTPVPVISANATQRHSGGHKETQFGLTLNFNFDLPWEDQISSRTVAEMRTVEGSRHDFVNRQNEMILEYRAKENFHIDFLGRVGVNQFKFRIRNGFDQYVAGQAVRVTAGGGVLLAEIKAPVRPAFLAGAREFLGGLFSAKAAYAAELAKTYVTDQNGEFIVELDTVTALPAFITAQVGQATRTVDLQGATLTSTLTVSRTDAQVLPVGASVAGVAFALDSNTPGLVQNKTVSLAWSGTGSFDNPPSSATTDASGNFSLSLKGLTAGTATLTATLPDGRTVTVDLTVAASTLTLTRTDTQVLPVDSTVAGVSFTLSDDNAPASVQSKTVSLAWSAGAFDSPPSSATTDASGNFSLSLKGQTAGAVTLTVTLPDGRTVTYGLTVADYAITVALTGVDVVAIGGGFPTATPTQTTIKATVTLNGSAAPVGTRINWSFVGSEIYNQTGNVITLTGSPFTEVAGAAGETTFTFTPSEYGLSAGSAGYVIITGTVAAVPSVNDSVDNIAVGFDEFRTNTGQWYDNGGQGATAICSNNTAGKNSSHLPFTTPQRYFDETMLPTEQQLKALQDHLPVSVTPGNSYWTGQGRNQSMNGAANTVTLGPGGGSGWVAAESNTLSRTVCLR